MTAGRDRGAALLVAISFVVMVGAITAGLSTLVTSGLADRVVLEHVRDREYAADGAVEGAIAEVRAGIDDGSITCSRGGGSSTASLNATAVRVDWVVSCTTVVDADGSAVVQRAAVFRACVDAGSPCAAGAVLLTAAVGFEQDGAGEVSHASVRSWSVGR